MNPRDALDRLGAVLDAEREAIRRLDGAAVERFAEEKSAILHCLRDAAGRGDRAALEGAETLTEALRRNVILLAHARECMSDALGLSPPGVGARPSYTPHRLSLRG